MSALDTDVVVVGAGIAGLSAARALEAAGQRVIVLEARDRVGGRVWNTEVRGQPQELGGQWIAPYQTEMHALVAELGLQLFHSYREGERVYLDGAGTAHRYTGHDAPLGASAERSYAAAAAQLDALASELDPEAPWDHPRAAELDATTFEVWLQREVEDDLARDLLRAYLSGGYLTKPSHTFSLLGGLWTIAGAGGVENLFEPDLCLHSRVVGGSQLIPIRMAESLDHHVVVGSPVRAIRWTQDEVAVATESERLHARHAVLAIPPNLGSTIRFDPVLPPWRLRAEQGISQGSVIKVLAVYDRPFWRDDGLAGEAFAPYQLVREAYDNSPPGGEPGVLVTFLAAERCEQAERMDPAARRDAVLDGLAALFGERARTPLEVIELNWSAEEWSRGAYSATFQIGGLTRFGADLRRPIGPLHWACTDIAGVGNMHMEGAVRSGRAAVAAILDA
jgi:putrescine oxidase